MARSTLGSVAEKARNVMRTLEDESFSTAAQLRLLSAHRGSERLARELVKLYCDLFPDDPELPDHDELTRLVGFLVLLCGRAGAERIARTAPRTIGGDLLRHHLELPVHGPVPEVDTRLFAPPDERSAEWPVISAHATVPDGYGNQALWLVRQRPDGVLALAGLIFSEIRGIADAIGNPGLSRAEAARILAELQEASGGLFDVPVGYVMDRARQGMAIAAANGIPLPLEVRLQDYLFAGLWDVPFPDGLESAALEMPGLLQDRNAPFLDHPCLESWFLTELDGPTVRPFLQAMAVGAKEGADLDPILDEYARPILEPIAETLIGRLVQAAYLFGKGGLEAHAAGAAAAARALREGPAAAVPFCRWLLLRTFLESEFGWLVEGWSLISSPAESQAPPLSKTESQTARRISAGS